MDGPDDTNGAGRRPPLWSDALAIAALAGVIAASWADLLVRPDEARSVVVERRAPAPFPTVEASLASWSALPERFQAWFDDHFGLRDRFLAAHSALRVFGFGVAPSEEVVIGRDRWVFSTAQRSVEVYRGVAPLTQRQLDAWRRALESRRDLLAESGIRYVFAFAPSKQFVYPEFMPARYDVVGPSRLDQLVAYLDVHSDLEVLDLRDALIAAKAEDTADDFTYFPLGTHWNHRGGFAAAEALRERLVRELGDARPLGELPVPVYKEVDEQGDSWAARLYLPGVLLQSVRNFAWTREDRLQWVHTEDPRTRRRTFDRRTDESSSGEVYPRALVFHDSFGQALYTSLPHLFSHTTFDWRHNELDQQLIAEVRPDVVIQLYVDRVLVAVTPRGVGDVDRRAAHDVFDSTTETLLDWDPVTNTPPCRPRNLLHGVAPSGSADAAGFEFEVEHVAGTLLLPRFEFPEDGTVVLALSLDCPEAANGALMYLAGDATEYTRTSQVPWSFEAGRNEVFVELLERDLHGQLLLWPGAAGGPFKLSRFEVRAVR